MKYDGWAMELRRWPHAHHHHSFRPWSKAAQFQRPFRQLRMAWDRFFARSPDGFADRLSEKTRLEFNNDVPFLEDQVRCEFPAKIDNFRKLQTEDLDYKRA